jgi:hypothetical protein
MKKYLIISLFIFCFNSLWAQLFVGYSTGYDISANRFKVLRNESPFIQYSYVNGDSSIYLPLGEGIRNSISLGYKSKCLLFELSIGGNFNALNLNYLDDGNSYNYRDKPRTITHTDTAYVGQLYSPYFDEYMTFEYMSRILITYNIVNITPSVSYITGKENFHFLIKSGFSFNFSYINYIVNYENNFYSASSSGTTYQSLKNLIKTDNPTVSWLLGFGVSYDVSESFNLSFNLDYKPLTYNVAYWEKLSSYHQINVGGETVYELSETYDGEEEFIQTGPWLPLKYDFTTFGVGIGIKYYFGSHEKGNVSH